jgi:hypothetical protein
LVDGQIEGVKNYDEGSSMIAERDCGTPTATIKSGLLPPAWGEKNWVVSSS